MQLLKKLQKSISSRTNSPMGSSSPSAAAATSPTGSSPIAKLYFYGLFASLAYLVFGTDTGMIGSITTMEQFENKFGHMKEIIRGLVVSVILLLSTVSGFGAGWMADRIGRKRTIQLGAVIFIVGEVISIASPNLGTLIAGRCIMGVGEGLFLSTSSTYAVEIAPARHRGRLGSASQFMSIVGLVLGYFSVYGSVNVEGDLAFQIPFMIQIAICVVLTVGLEFLPHSPRWLLQRGRVEEARAVMNALDKPGYEAEKEEALAAGRTGDYEANKSSNIFAKDVVGKTLWAGWLCASQQLTGIDFVLYFAPLLFQQAGLTASSASFLASGVTSLVFLGTSCVVIPFMDRIPRRASLIGGGLATGASMLLIGILYASGAARSTAGRWTVIGLIELFAIAFSCSWGPTIRIYAVEVQPPKTRAGAASFGIACNQGANFMVALTAPAFLAASSAGPYLLFGGLTIFTSLLCVFYMAETNGHSLEAIQRASNSATQPHQKILQALKSKYGPASQRGAGTQQQPSTIELDTLDPNVTASGRSLSVGTAERRASINTARRPSGMSQPAHPLSTLGQAPAVFDEDDEETDDVKGVKVPGEARPKY